MIHFGSLIQANAHVHFLAIKWAFNKQAFLQQPYWTLQYLPLIFWKWFIYSFTIVVLSIIFSLMEKHIC